MKIEILDKRLINAFSKKLDSVQNLDTPIKRALSHIHIIQNKKKANIDTIGFFYFFSEHGLQKDLEADLADRTLNELRYHLSSQSPLFKLSTNPYRSLFLVDLGLNDLIQSEIDYWIHKDQILFSERIAWGTENWIKKRAMSTRQFNHGYQIGWNYLKKPKSGDVVVLSSIHYGSYYSNIVCAAAILDNSLVNLLKEIKLGYRSAYSLEELDKFWRYNPKTHETETIVSLYGGFELAALIGAIRSAAAIKKGLVLEGFASVIALKVALMKNPEIMDYILEIQIEDIEEYKVLADHLNIKPSERKRSSDPSISQSIQYIDLLKEKLNLLS